MNGKRDLVHKMLAQVKRRENEEGKEQPETEYRMSEGMPRYHSKKMPNNMKRSEARESKGTPAKARVSKGPPKKAPESFARSLCSLASLAPSNDNTR